jgi:N-acylglucosamine 2-epimerase/mannose-6-phosphate isomerase
MLLRRSGGKYHNTVKPAGSARKGEFDLKSVERSRSWLFDRALPYWSARAEDRAHGGTVQELALDGGPSDPGFKRVRVLCRQVYVWSHASLLGWKPGRDLAETYGHILMRTCRQGPGLGWARLLRPDNTILDPRPDLYDTAFAVFGRSWLHRATRSS